MDLKEFLIERKRRDWERDGMDGWKEPQTTWLNTYQSWEDQ